MIIAVNTRFLLKDKLEGYGYFVKETFKLLATQYPQHQFYFLFDRPFDPEFIFAENVHPLILLPPARHPLLWKYWYDFKIPMALKRIRADVFVSPDGICSLTTNVPQCLVAHDLGLIHRPRDYKASHVLFYKRYIPQFLKKAKTIATVSAFSRDDIVKKYGTDPDKIYIVFSAAKEIFRPSGAREQTATKEKWTGGNEFFIYVGAIHPRKNLVNLLKAFSIFKKRQQSNMKLVLAGRLSWKNGQLLQLLKTYKYRDDIVLTDYIDEGELVLLLGSAYALVYPSLFEGFGVPVLEAMKCGVAVLTSEKTSMQEIAGEAGLYFDPGNYNDIAEKMMLIYKDERLRKELIEKGARTASKFSWQRTAGLLWESILKAADN